MNPENLRKHFNGAKQNVLRILLRSLPPHPSSALASVSLPSSAAIAQLLHGGRVRLHADPNHVEIYVIGLSLIPLTGKVVVAAKHVVVGGAKHAAAGVIGIKRGVDEGVKHGVLKDKSIAKVGGLYDLVYYKKNVLI
jgi:hypothetical protein